MSVLAPVLMRGEVADSVSGLVTTYFPFFVDYFRDAHLLSKVTLLGLFFVLVTLFAFAHNFATTLPNRLRLWLAKLFRTYERDIIYKDHSNHQYVGSEETTVNKAIVRSIRLHVYRQFEKTCVNSGTVSLLDMKEPFVSQDGAFRSVDALKKMELVGFPSENIWYEIPNQSPKISLRHSITRRVDGTNIVREMQMTLRCSAPNGDLVIKEFVNKCHMEFIRHSKSNKDRNRYFYQLQSFSTPESDTGVSVPMFKRFPISDDRDFDTMFFPEKISVTRLIDNFTNKTGKFGIEGFPHKLGLLLHGPPGTGKTTFVKAIAAHLHRHIVSIPLGKIKKNQQLYDIMFEGVYHVEGDSEGPYDLDLKNVVFLMEEIDAASTVVKTRCDEPTAIKSMEAENSGDEKEEGEGAEKKEAGDADGSSDTVDVTKVDDEEKEDDEEDESEPSAPAGRGRGRGRGSRGRDRGPDNSNGKKKKKEEKKLGLFDSLDNFDLAGLLNVLDGVVDSPGRVVLMTTNHPDQLDPALIRPGRINTTLHLGFMKQREMFEMIRHHFGVEATDSMEPRIRNILKSKDKGEKPFRITPAEMEQICAESDTIEEFCAALNFFPKVNAITTTVSEGM